MQKPASLARRLSRVSTGEKIAKVGNKYGASTTHMEKLLPRIEGGGGGGCPILAFGITSAKYVEDNAPIAEQASENGDEDSE